MLRSSLSRKFMRRFYYRMNIKCSYWVDIYSPCELNNQYITIQSEGNEKSGRNILTLHRSSLYWMSLRQRIIFVFVKLQSLFSSMLGETFYFYLLNVFIAIHERQCRFYFSHFFLDFFFSSAAWKWNYIKIAGFP